MLQHLELLFGRALTGKIEITALKATRDAGPRTRFFGVDQLDEAVDFAAEVNAEHMWNVYVGAALRSDDVFPGQAADDTDFLCTFAVWADADNEAEVARAREVYTHRNIQPSCVVVTGRTPDRRAQFWWVLDEPITEVETLRQTVRAIADDLGTDHGVLTGKQLMRLGGGLSWPKPNKPGRILERTEIARPANALREVPLDQVHRAFPLGSRAAPTGGVIAKQLLVPEHPERLSQRERWHLTHQPGGWHQGALEFTASLVRDGVNPSAIVAMAPAFQRPGYTLAQTEAELLVMAEGAWRKYRPEESPVSVNDDGDIIDQVTGEILSERDHVSLHKEFPDSLTRVPGLLGAIIDWMEVTARFPQRGLALGAALCVVGTAAGRKYSTPTKSGTHLYTLVLAPTGAGKNHAAKLGKRLMSAASMSRNIGPSQYMSMSAIFNDLATEPKRLAFIDEFGGYMSRIASAKGSPHERAVKDVLRTAWGSSFEVMKPLAYADGRKIEDVQSPALSIYGMSTPDEFYKALEGSDVFNGFLNRFLVIATDTKPAEVEPVGDEFEIPGLILHALTEVRDVGPAGISKSLNPDGPSKRVDFADASARAAYTALKKDLERRGEEEALLSRVAEMAIRLATIRAVGCSPNAPAVTLEDMEWGRDVALWSAERVIADAHDFMVESEFQGRAMLILRTLKAAPGRRMTRTELTRKLKHKYDTKTLDAVLGGLRESGEVVELVEPAGPKGGAPKKVYAYVG